METRLVKVNVSKPRACQRCREFDEEADELACKLAECQLLLEEFGYHPRFRKTRLAGEARQLLVDQDYEPNP